MFKYQVSSYKIEIEKIEVEKETEKTIWIKRKRYDGKTDLDQSRKDSSWNKYFDTFEDAKNYLLTKNESEFVSLNREIEDNRKKHFEIKKLQEVTK